MVRQALAKVGMQSDLQIALSTAAEDGEWDAFVSDASGGDLLQSSLWSQLKETVGWRVLRLVLKQEKRIIGGAQILVRPLPFFMGAVGYVPRGPLLAVDDPVLAQLLVDQLRVAARRHRLQVLIVQPPYVHAPLATRLAVSGFRPTSTTVAPAATLRIDLTKECDAILAEMRSGTRHSIRRSQRDGVTVREGTAADLPVFSRLHAVSSRRHGFSTYSEEYFVNMWRLFAPANCVQLLFSEVEGEAVSAMLLAAFGDTVWAKRFGWSGKHRRCSPNEPLLWGAISWAKEQGYHYFDLDGIARRAAEALVNEEPLPEYMKQTPTYFKLGFGGEPLLFPEPFAHVYNPLFRLAYNSLFSAAKKSTRKKVINLLRLG